MAVSEKAKHIGAELKGHAPFTLFGAVAGLAFMVVFMRIGKPAASTFFEIFHPLHVLLSAMATASMFAIHRKAKNFLLILVIGYVGSIGIATLSDSVVPYIGENILGLDVPTHADVHSEEVEKADRIGFISRGKLIEEGTPQEIRDKYNVKSLEEVFLTIHDLEASTSGD